MRATTGLQGPRWMGWRLRFLVLLALAGCVAIFLLARWMAATPTLDAQWRADAQGRIELAGSDAPALQARLGQVLVGIAAGGREVDLSDGLALQRSARWVIADDQRERLRQVHEAVSALLNEPAVELRFADGARVLLEPMERGFRGLPVMYWVLSLLALVLYLLGAVVPMARPHPRNLLYTLIAWCQAGTLVLVAVECSIDLRLPPPFPALDMPLRTAFDLASGAAIITAFSMYPRRVPAAAAVSAVACLSAAVTVWAVQQARLPFAWWWVQGLVAAYSVAVIVLMTWSYRLTPHPFAVVQRRFGWAVLGTWMLLTAAIVAALGNPVAHQNIASIGSLIWYLFFASLVVLVPFLSRSQQVMREFSLLAAVSTIATSLDLLFVAVFSLGQFASLTLSLFVGVAVYAGARQWILNQLLGSSVVTTERMFEQLYRIAREVEAHPERAPVLLSQLLRELFEPMEVSFSERLPSTTRVLHDGATLVVPVPRLESPPDAAPVPGAIEIRFAQRGRRLFTSEDVRLTDRIVEQLRRAVAFDKAVEQGRSEERARLAQDLHDDIGARLLTLMYQAQSPEMEDYVRHTLQDLKTLTRGLAATNHRFSHSTAEWKADLTQRLTAAHVELGWNCEYDTDPTLTVVQWSGLTRVLRELVSNAISHARARRVDIDIRLADDRLELRVVDDGVGRNPQAWSHGLGLGGVRKRIKQLGGEVEWREAVPRGIACQVRIADFSARG